MVVVNLRNILAIAGTVGL